MTQVWVLIEDRAPTGTDPIVDVYSNIHSAVSAARKIVGKDADVTKPGPGEVVVGSGRNKYYINRYRLK